MAYYHYCSTEAFFQIAKNKSIWLSSLTASNDSLEGKWFRNVLGGLCDEKGVQTSDKHALLEMSGAVESITDCLGFCMSEVDDALSQWRGYADDGAGVSIGFADDFIETYKEKTPTARDIYLQRVVYRPEDQRDLMLPTFEQMLELIADGALKRPARGTILYQKSEEEYSKEMAVFRKKNRDLFNIFTLIMPGYFALKNPAFAEEREWRLTSVVVKLLDQVDFRVRSGRLVEYEPLNLPEASSLPISEVILGPKNTTPVDVVQRFLQWCGFDHRQMNVRVSSASYR
ncbi:hypothetical protein ABIA24_001825 [Sinorhizobium fredii]|uniref:DUF2971 domain-containing protein n=1 Tax=Rhizobium fredii TaxID=380 RepID=UPI0035141806